MNVLTNLNLNKNELQNAVLQPLSAAPSNPRLGQIYFNSNDKKIYSYDGSDWVVSGAVIEKSDNNGKILVNGTEIEVYTLPKASEDTLGGVTAGEGVEIDENGKISTIPSNHYTVDKNGNESDNEAISRAVGSNTLRDGDTCVVRTLITGDKYSYTAFVYDGTWKAMDGNYNAENVYFDQDLVFTYQFGKYKPDTTGSVTVPSTSKNIVQLLQDTHSEDTEPTTTYPTATLSVSGGNGEVGSSYTLPTATLKITGIGSYTYGSKDASDKVYGKEETGVTFDVGDVTISEGDDNSKSNTSVLVKNSTLTLQATDDNTLYTDGTKSYTFTGTAKYTGSDRVPVTALGNKVESKQIGYPNGTGNVTVEGKTASFTGWRKMFMGTLTDASTEINSAVIRGLSLVSAKVSTDAQTFTAPVGAAKIVLAFPSEYTVSKVEYFTMSWEGFEGFTQAESVNVADYRGGTNGLKQYTVFTYTPAGAFEADTQFRVTLKNA